MTLSLSSAVPWNNVKMLAPPSSVKLFPPLEIPIPISGVCTKSLQLCLILQPYGWWPTRLLCRRDTQTRMLEGVAIPFTRDLLKPGIELTVPPLAGSFTTRATWQAHQYHRIF